MGLEIKIKMWKSEFFYYATKFWTGGGWSQELAWPLRQIIFAVRWKSRVEGKKLSSLSREEEKRMESSFIRWQEMTASWAFFTVLKNCLKFCRNIFLRPLAKDQAISMAPNAADVIMKLRWLTP